MMQTDHFFTCDFVYQKPPKRNNRLGSSRVNGDLNVLCSYCVFGKFIRHVRNYMLLDGRSVPFFTAFTSDEKTLERTVSELSLSLLFINKIVKFLPSQCSEASAVLPHVRSWVSAAKSEVTLPLRHVEGQYYCWIVRKGLDWKRSPTKARRKRCRVRNSLSFYVSASLVCTVCASKLLVHFITSTSSFF